MFRKNKYKKISYAQSGEDVIIDFILTAIGINNPTYIDIGAHHPFYLSNTAFFYEKGCRGICIEPDPILFQEIKKYRKYDICLNVGIGLDEKDEADFYIMTASTLNTFSKEQALEYESYGNTKIKKIKKIPLKNINSIIKDYYQETPNIISLDVEGLDYGILKTFNFAKYRPEVFCLETLTYTENNTEIKIKEIIEFMLSNNYMIYADTYINTIFVDRKVWVGRRQ